MARCHSMLSLKKVSSSNFEFNKNKTVSKPLEQNLKCYLEKFTRTTNIFLRLLIICTIEFSRYFEVASN